MLEPEKRIGKFTASNAHRAFARTKSGPGAERENYKFELLVERRTGVSYPRFVTAQMQLGIDNEPHARNTHAWKISQEVIEVGFIDHPRIPMSGCSPDGFIGEDGLVEYKCPGSTEHIRVLAGGSVPKRYQLQVRWQLACTGRQWCDWVSFDPRFKEEDEKLEVRRLYRDETYPEIPTIAIMEEMVCEFLAEVDAEIRKLDERLLLRRKAP